MDIISIKENLYHVNYITDKILTEEEREIVKQRERADTVIRSNNILYFCNRIEDGVIETKEQLLNDNKSQQQQLNEEENNKC